MRKGPRIHTGVPRIKQCRDCTPATCPDEPDIDLVTGLYDGCCALMTCTTTFEMVEGKCESTRVCTVDGVEVDPDQFIELPPGTCQMVMGCLKVAIDPASITAAFEAALVDLPTLIAEAVANAATSTAVPGQPCCVLIDGAPGFATPVSVLAADGSVVSVTWLSGDGQAIAGTVAPAAPADCDCLLAAACADCP